MSNTVLLIDKIEQIPYISSRGEQGKIIAFNPSCYVALEKAGFDFERVDHIENICIDLQNDTFEYSERLLNEFVEYADGVLFKHSIDCREQEIRLFHYNRYKIKLLLDSALFNVFVLNKVFQKYKPQRVIYLCTGVSSEVDFRFSNNSSIIELLIKRVCRHYSAELVLFDDIERTQTHQVLYDRGESLNYKLKLALLNLKNKFKREVFDQSQPLVIVSDSREIEYLEDQLVKEGIQFKNSAEILKSSRPVAIDLDLLYRDLCHFEKIAFNGISFSDLVFSRLKVLLNEFIPSIQTYYGLEAWVTNNPVTFGVFGTHSSHNIKNVLLPKILKENGLRFACWMHGGIGHYLRTPGFEQADFMFGDIYLTYGDNARDMADQMSKLETRTLGSRISRLKYDKSKIKETITVTMPPWQINSFMLGERFNEYYFNFWPTLEAIFHVLGKHQENYEIVIRSLPDENQNFTLNTFLENHSYHNIKVLPVGTESLFEIYERTALHISLWVSTTFWEAALSDARILLFDQGPMTEEGILNIESRADRFTELGEFCQSLDQILVNGELQNSKIGEHFLAECLNHSQFSSLAQRTAQLIKEYSKS